MTNKKHTAYDLKQMQSLPLDIKIRMTKERIRQWYEYWDGMVYVSFSGGKDSTVLKHIVDSMYDDVPSLFINTGLEYPEIQKFVMTQKNVVSVRPEMRFDEAIKKYGYPVVSKEIADAVSMAKRGFKSGIQKINGVDKYGNENPWRNNLKKWKYLIDAPFDVGDGCCYIMKKKPATAYEKVAGRKPILATMANESRMRKASWMRTGCNAFESKRPISQPLSFWTEQDILHYIKEFDIRYCSIYGDIVENKNKTLTTTNCDRTGCIFCAFGCHNEKEPNRFQRLKETHPRQYEYCIGGGEYVDGKWQPSKEGLGLGKVLDYINVKY